MQAIYELCDPAGPEEPNTVTVTVEDGHSPEQVVTNILHKLDM